MPNNLPQSQRDFYEEGQVLGYWEGASVCMVRVLKNLCNERNICYRLKMAKVVIPGPLFEERNIGDIWVYSSVRGVGDMPVVTPQLLEEGELEELLNAGSRLN